MLDTFTKVGGTVLANACGPCIGQWKRTEVKKGKHSFCLFCPCRFASSLSTAGLQNKYIPSIGLHWAKVMSAGRCEVMLDFELHVQKVTVKDICMRHATIDSTLFHLVYTESLAQSCSSNASVSEIWPELLCRRGKLHCDLIQP